jgi:hypothetical protein
VARIAPKPHAQVPGAGVPNAGPLMAYAMVHASRIAAILVGSFGPPRLDVALGYIQAVHQGMVCWVNIDEINLANIATRMWIDDQQVRLGRPAGTPVRPGYYLFLNGQAVAYHSGLIDFKRDKASIGAGAAAAIAALYWQSNALFAGALQAGSFQASVRVVRCFEAAITGQQPHTAHQAAPPPAEEALIDELGLAFEVLGIEPSATKDEIKARFRALAKVWHPDRFINDPQKLDEAGVRMRQINVAYSVISEAQRW